MSRESHGNMSTTVIAKPKAYVVAEPFTYCSAWNYITVPDYTIANADRQFSNSTLAGVAILKALKKLIGVGDTEKMKVEALYMTFVEMSRDWTWDPFAPCTTPKLLDNAGTAFECGAFAAAFKSLAVTKPPFGLGLNNDDFIYHTYSGEKVRGKCPGFISFHPEAGFLNLLPNIHTPIGLVTDEALNGSSFYFWDNHKVVEYDGRFFDPTYGVQYAAIQDMAALTITDWEVLGSKGGTLAWNAFKDSADTDLVGNHVVEAKTKANRTYFFRTKPKNLRARATLRWEGPLTKEQIETLTGKLTLAPNKAVTLDEIL